MLLVRRCQSPSSGTPWSSATLPRSADQPGEPLGSDDRPGCHGPSLRFCSMGAGADTTSRRRAGPFEDNLPPGLTPGQREAVMADEPVLCVLAGAGAGKTGVLTLRVARRSGDATGEALHTLVCTFSRKAADELRLRLFRLGVVGVTAGTIHRGALQIGRAH